VTTWHEVIGEPTLGDAILDRIVHNATARRCECKIKASEATEPAASPVATLAADSKPARE
jgi:hypothetical protein